MEIKKWSQAAWEAAEPTYRSILSHPFVRALADGTLPKEKFIFYLQQDALYLAVYAQVLAHTASRLSRPDHVSSFLGFATDGIAVEEALHTSFLGGKRPSPDEISPTCLLYTSVLSAQAAAPVEVQAASVLPCFWVYQRVGEHILAGQQGNTNPYARWIDTYADPAFAAATRRAIDICDNLAAKTSDEVRGKMTDIFVRCTKLEWIFWDSAWQQENWKI